MAPFLTQIVVGILPKSSSEFLTQTLVGIFRLHPNRRRNFSREALSVVVTAFDQGKVAAPIDQAVTVIG